MFLVAEKRKYSTEELNLADRNDEVDVMILSMRTLSLHSRLKLMTGRAVQVPNRDRKVKKLHQEN